MKNNAGTLIMAVVIIIITLLFVQCSGGGKSYDNDPNHCTICRKTATHIFQGSGYCDEHYIDAVSWAVAHSE